MAARSLPDNTISYKLFFGNGDDSANEISKREDLEVLAESHVAKLSGLISRYIWQKEHFNLKFTDEVQDAPAHLEGITFFGDNIEDEWFIVYLLFHLSEKDKNLIIQVQDSDGDFLLIEAAEYIPKWLNPETSENRVFIYHGKLHIIPLAQSPAEITPIPTGRPSIKSALAAIRQFTSITQASPSIQSCVQRRLEGYPHKIDEFKHRAHCYIPASVAAILKEDPQLLPYAVNAFFERDPIDMKACRAMKYFAPETRVMTEVVFTRCLYAQLLSQQYQPDRIIGWKIPAKNSPQFKALDLGMKLACGFEILAANAEKLMSIDDDELYEQDFNNDVRWKRFSKSLKDKGYFHGELEGSKLFQQLLSQAKNYYLTALKTDHNKNLSPGTRVKKLLETMSINYEEMKESEKYLQDPDDDSWMEITPETLDALLEQASKQPTEDFLPYAITDSLKSFVNQKSDIDGVEFPDPNSKKQKVSYNPDMFVDPINTILDFRVPGSDDEGSSSSMSSYSNDDDSEVELGEVNALKKSKSKILSAMKCYMDQMDREIAKTDVGLSFERLPKEAKNAEGGRDINKEEDDFTPVDVNLTTLQNMLESCISQQGLPGPATTLLAQLALRAPPNFGEDI